MVSKTLLLAATIALTAPAAMAGTLTTSLATFQASTAGQPVVSTTTFPGFDPTALSVTTNAIPLPGGSLGLSNTAAVTQAMNTPYGYFPYALPDGFTGELFVPNDANGSDVSSETITISNGISALGFEVAPYGDAVGAPYSGAKGGPYTVTVTLDNGQSAAVSLPGGSFSTGVTASQFFGFTGGGVNALTITVTSATAGTGDPNGLAFGNFVSVPEPATAALLLGGIVLTAARRRQAA